MTTQLTKGRRHDILQEETHAGLHASLSADSSLGALVQSVLMSKLSQGEQPWDSKPLTKGAP